MAAALPTILILTLSPAIANDLYRLGAPQQLNVDTATQEFDPVVSCDAGGAFRALWVNYDADFLGIVSRTFDRAGTPTSAELPVNTVTTAAQDSPDYARDAAGNYVVVWRDSAVEGPGNSYGLRARLFSSAGVGGTEFPVNSYLPGIQSAPAVARTAAGNFVVVWNGPGPGGVVGAWMRRFDASGSPLDIETLVAAAGQYPKVEFNPLSGGFVVAWHEYNGSDYEVRARRFDSVGAPLGAVLNVNTTTGGNQLFVDLAVRSDGDFVVVFQGEGQGDNAGILGQLYSAAGIPIGGEFWVNSETASEQVAARVEFDAAGGFAVAWSTVLEATQFRAFATHFSPTAIRDAANDLPVTATLAAGHAQLLSALCCDGSSTFRTVFSDRNAAGTDSEILSQRLGFILFADGFESADTTAWLP